MRRLEDRSAEPLTYVCLIYLGLKVTPNVSIRLETDDLPPDKALSRTKNGRNVVLGPSDQDNSLSVVSGRVKWFDPLRGFGFIVSESVDHDILLHANVLRNFGQSTVADGTEITVAVHRTDRGVQAAEVVSIEKPSPVAALRPDSEFVVTEEDLASLPLLPARVKWFDRAKGFGFVNVFSRHEDVFLHVEALRAAGLAELAPGEAVAIRLMEGKRGKVVVQIVPWDDATREDVV